MLSAVAGVLRTLIGVLWPTTGAFGGTSSVLLSPGKVLLLPLATSKLAIHALAPGPGTSSPNAAPMALSSDSLGASAPTLTASIPPNTHGTKLVTWRAPF